MTMVAREELPAGEEAQQKEDISVVEEDESAEEMKTPPIPKTVAKVFDSYKPKDRNVLLKLRSLVFQVAESDERIGTLTETLKWGEPAYLTTKTKAGSTVRLGVSKQGHPTVFVSCSTPLIESFQALAYDKVISMVPPRELTVPDVTEENREVLQKCIAMTLTYHLNKGKRKSR